MNRDLLIISDEVDSTKRSPSEVQERTPKHFAAFLKILLKDPHFVRNTTYVVKNIGDSLMIRVTADDGAGEVVRLLGKILDCASRFGWSSTATGHQDTRPRLCM